MRHYEIILMIHPDHSEKIPLIIEEYKKIINNNSGIIHRLEDWGRRQLSYSIKKLQKAHYILLNVEISTKTMNLLETEFRFSNIMIRNMIISMKKAVTESSPIFKLKDDKNKLKDDKKEKNKINHKQ